MGLYALIPGTDAPKKTLAKICMIEVHYPAEVMGEI